MAAGFTGPLAESLSKRSHLPVREARQGEALEPGCVLLAPGGSHLELVPRRAQGDALFVRLHQRPPVKGCRPSVDVCWRSVAAHYPGTVLNVVMTGMGKDGCEGASALKDSGAAHCIAQDESSSVIWGMPKAVVEANLADEILPLEDLGPRIAELVRVGIKAG